VLLYVSHPLKNVVSLWMMFFKENNFKICVFVDLLKRFNDIFRQLRICLS
jgi:hypothetical protein